MTEEERFALHPLAAQDITEIWEYIAEDSLVAARRVREEIHSAIRGLVFFPRQGHRRPNLTPRPLRSKSAGDGCHPQKPGAGDAPALRVLS